MARRQQKKVYQTNKNRLVAAFLAFTFGIFGVHKFYLNKSGGGIFYIIMFIMGINIFNFPISFLFGMVDFMKLIFMSDEEFDDKYNGRIRTTYNEQKRSRRNVVKQRARKDKEVRTSKRAKRNNPFKISGQKKYEDYDVDGAISDYEEGLKITPDDADLHFMIAQAYSLNENAEKSYNHLTKAIELGYSSPEKILSEDDFAFLRIDSQFDAFKENGYKKVPASFQKKEDIQDDVLLSQLNKLAELRKRGLLSENEFLAEKEKLMNR